MIYVAYHDGPEQTDDGGIDWRPGWHAICDECSWSTGPWLTEADANDAADQHAVAMGEATWEELELARRLDQRERPAAPGERCTCGRQAIVVYLGSAFGPTGYCGIADGGDRAGPCPFCGGCRHTEGEGRCPDYRLRLDQRPTPEPQRPRGSNPRNPRR
jgi:hypothetical protein